jgi:exonuclease III
MLLIFNTSFDFDTNLNEKYDWLKQFQLILQNKNKNYNRYILIGNAVINAEWFNYIKNNTIAQ